MESCLASAEMSKWPALVVEGVAFQKKASTELGWLAAGTAAEIDAVENLVGVLTADAAFGLALLEETQRSIDMMVLSGEIDKAKRLTGFRNRLGRSVGEIKDQIGEEAFGKAESLSDGFIAPSGLKEAEWKGTAEIPAYIKRHIATPATSATSATPAANAAEAAIAAAPAAIDTATIAIPEERARHTKSLAMVLGVRMCVWSLRW